jgi:hypothetical protein
MPGLPGSDASLLSGYLPGLTTTDYKEILSQDLFWKTGATQTPTIPASRFEQQPQNFTYDPGSTGNCGTEKRDVENTHTDTISSSTENDYKASLGVGGDIGVVGLSVSQDMTWTDKVSTEKKAEKTQTASATVACASASWTGPFNIAAYYDALYGTFLFVLDPLGGMKLVQGTVSDMDGDPVPHEPLTLLIGSETYSSFSHNNGHFLFALPVGQTAPSATSGTLTVGGAGGSSQTVSIGPTATATALIPTPPPSLSVALTGPPEPPHPNPPSNQNAQSARMSTTASSTQAARMTGSANSPPPEIPPLFVAVKNESVFATAKNVTVTSIKAATATGVALVWNGSLPFVVAGGTALKAGGTSVFPVAFSNAAAGAPTYLAITVSADNRPPFSTVLIQTVNKLQSGSQSQ